jgi:hypothetical protein
MMIRISGRWFLFFGTPKIDLIFFSVFGGAREGVGDVILFSVEEVKNKTRGNLIEMEEGGHGGICIITSYRSGYPTCYRDAGAGGFLGVVYS